MLYSLHVVLEMYFIEIFRELMESYVSVFVYIDTYVRIYTYLSSYVCVYMYKNYIKFTFISSSVNQMLGLFYERYNN